MGVQGLWQLLQSTGKPVTLESLEGKILAVDVSIWLNQTLKGMRDQHGNVLPNAHLIGVFNRVCKLLFYGIKPIFVFDGGVPILKRRTLAARRQRKEEAASGAEKTGRKLLHTLLKRHALNAAMGGDSNVQMADRPNASSASGTSDDIFITSDDIFILPPVPESSTSEPGRNKEEEAENMAWEQRMAQREAIYEEFQNPEELDLESDDFHALPPEIQHELLSDIKDARKYHTWLKPEEAPVDSQEFSDFQVAKLIKQSQLSQKLNDVRKVLNTQDTGSVVSELSLRAEGASVDTRRVLSDDTTHYVLVKGLKNIQKAQKDQEEAGQTIIDDGVDVVEILKESRKKNASTISLESESEVDWRLKTDGEFSRGMDSVAQNMDTMSSNSSDVQLVSESLVSEADANALASDDANSTSRPVFSVDSEANLSEVSSKVPETIDISDDDENTKGSRNTESDYCVIIDTPQSNRSSCSKERELVSATQQTSELRKETPIIDISNEVGFVRDEEDAKSNSFEVRAISDADTQNGSKSGAYVVQNSSDSAKNFESSLKKGEEPNQVDLVPNKESSTKEESSDSEDDFMEVTIDPQAAPKEDDLFPASMFETSEKTTSDALADSVTDEITVEEIVTKKKKVPTATLR